MACGDGGLLLRALLFLPSPDVFRMLSACRSAKLVMANCGRRLWENLVLDGGKGTIASRPILAMHAHGSLWLHALLDAPGIARYAEEVKRLRVAGDLQFRSPHELTQMAAAVARIEAVMTPDCGATSGSGSVFAAPLAFAAAEAEALANALSGAPLAAPVRSSPVRFRWRLDGKLGELFDVSLVVSPGERGLTLAWRPRFLGEVLQEASDCVELNIWGSLVLPFGEEGLLPRVKAYGSLRPLDAPDESGTACFGSSEPSAAAAEALRQGLLRGEPIVGVLRVELRSMGDVQDLTLADMVNLRDEAKGCPAAVRPTPACGRAFRAARRHLLPGGAYRAGLRQRGVKASA